MAVAVEALRRLGEMLEAAPKANGVRIVDGNTGAFGSVQAPPSSDLTDFATNARGWGMPTAECSCIVLAS